MVILLLVVRRNLSRTNLDCNETAYPIMGLLVVLGLLTERVSDLLGVRWFAPLDVRRLRFPGMLGTASTR